MSAIPNDTPTYNLKAVVQETGVKPDTLRAWERRYGLPQPDRTSGGHRVYSERDINILKWLVARQEEGLSISRAVDLWNQIEAEGVDPLQEMEYGEEEEVSGPAPLEVGDTLVQLRNSWVEACLDFDEQRAEYILAQAFAMYPPETTCLELLQKGLAEIGQRWYEGEATAQQEHFASELAMRRLEALLAIMPPPTREGRILLGCPPGEEHTFSPLLLTLLLRRRGWEAPYLGANVPMNRLEATVERTAPQLVIFSAQTLHTAGTLLELAELMEKKQVPFAYGGLIFNVAPSLRERMPGHFLGERIDQAPRTVEQLMASPSSISPAKRTSEKHKKALADFRRWQSCIEAQIWANAQEMDVPHIHLTRANYNMARNLTAALTLGTMEVLGYDLEWIEGLLANFHYHMPEATLKEYLRQYHEAATHCLSDDGAIVVEWLATVMNNSNGNKG